MFILIDRWLDAGCGSCVLKKAEASSHIIQPMHHFDGERYELGCYVVMPNHVHAIVRPMQPQTHRLENILKSWKSYAGRRINELTGKSGELWQLESYDRIIRDEEHLWHTIQYIGRNPQQAQLPPQTCPRWIRPEWEALGWKFINDV
jgi:putative transposase